MKKIIATVAATGLLLVGGAAASSTASAETLHRSGANKVTITAKGAPSGAHVTKARVTVKKGKKTVARNKPFYKAKKGTYKVTSTVTYRALTSYVPSGTGTEAFTGTCRVTSQPVVLSDRTSREASDWDWDTGTVTEDYVSGQATIGYSGTCTDWFWAYDRNGYLTTKTVTWNTTWQDDEYVYGYVAPGQAFDVAAEASHVVGDIAYLADPDSMPTVSTYAASLTTAKSIRTVVVR